MKELRNIILNIIVQKPKIDWLIIHEIAKATPNIANVEFSFIDGKPRSDEPFQTNQGYISLKTRSTVSAFIGIVEDLVDQLNGNSLALANLFVIITRTSYKQEERSIILTSFKRRLGTEQCTDVFNGLITDLNQEYFKRRTSPNPENVSKWLNLFVSAQYIHNISDPIISCLSLVRSEKSRELDFHLIEMMNPMLRAVLIGMYGYNLAISTGKLRELCRKKDEVAFLSACLIYDVGPDKLPPEWLVGELVEACVNDYWEVAGKYVFNRIFGISHRNTNQNQLYLELGRLISGVLSKKLLDENLSTQEWIKKFEFPTDFIALFEWTYDVKLNISKIPSENAMALTNKLVSELQRLSESILLFIGSENHEDPFLSYQVHESKYQNALAYILLHLLYATSEDKKRLENICHAFKPLFYGGHKASSLAIHFAEFMLLTFLSGPKITGLDETNHKTLNGYLKMLSNTITIPYIHLAERDDDIWNTEKEDPVSQFSAGRYLVANYMGIIRKSGMYNQYKSFLDFVDDVAVANWE